MKPFFSFLVLIIFLSLLRASTAAPLALDLGQGLAYHRAHALPADLPSASPAKPRPLVLDLRYAAGDADAGIALAAWLKFHAGPRSPIFLLANAATSPALRAAFAARDESAGLVVLGVASAEFTPDVDVPADPAEERRAYDALENGTALAAWLKFHAAPRSPIFLLANAATSPALRAAFAARDDAAGLVVLGVGSAEFTPDIALPVDPAEERRAYDALETGTALAALIAPPLEKPRYDEAKLVAERLPARDPPPKLDPAAPAPSAPPPLTDQVLQRAVHLHRALLALERL